MDLNHNNTLREALEDMYQTRLAQWNIPAASADELALGIDGVSLTGDQKCWVNAFLLLWETEENDGRIPDQHCDDEDEDDDDRRDCGYCGKDAGEDWQTVQDEHQEAICRACYVALDPVALPIATQCALFAATGEANEIPLAELTPAAIWQGFHDSHGIKAPPMPEMFPTLYYTELRCAADEDLEDLVARIDSVARAAEVK